MLTTVDFFRRQKSEFSRFHAKMCDSKNPLNIFSVSGLTANISGGVSMYRKTIGPYQ
jgi:hypothetical protein